MISILKRLWFQMHILSMLTANATRLFDRINRLDWYKGYLSDWLNGMALQAGKNVLEIGSATGVFTDQLASVGLNPVGVDRSDSMVSAAQKQFPHLRFVLNINNRLPFDDSHFDAVIGASLLNVVDDPLQVIREAIRVCKAGGTVSFLLPHLDFNRRKSLEVIESLNLSGFSAEAINTWQRAAKKTDPAGVMSLFQNAGLEKPTTSMFLNGAVYCVTAIRC